MKKLSLILVGLLMLSFIAIAGCTCQYEGAYEECLARGDALCLDIYPKCKNEQ